MSLLISGLEVAGDASDLTRVFAAGLAALVFAVVGHLLGVVAVDAAVAELLRVKVLKEGQARRLAVRGLVRIVPAVVPAIAVLCLGHALVVVAPAVKIWCFNFHPRSVVNVR